MENPQDNIQDTIVNAKDNLPDITPTPPAFHTNSSAKDVKSRLEWGEPALTIIDVRDRAAFNRGHIVGAMAMPLDVVAERAAATIDKVRDMYVYGDSNEQAAQAAQALIQAGFERVSIIQGGLEAWKAIAGPTDGTEESLNEPSPDSYNVLSQVKQHVETQNTL